MRPLKLTLEGFVGVRDGMKRDSVTLDLEKLPDGLIALTGPNGAGKTTIMDNLHPYQREFFISQTPDLVAEADAVIDVQALAA